MARLFSILAAIAVSMIVIAGASIYWVSGDQVAQAKQDSIVAVAKSASSGITGQINLLTDALQKMAQDPEVLAAVTSLDLTQITSVAAKLEQHLPGIMKIRLLLPGTTELDDKSVPKMGFADLDMVRETVTKNQLPAIQGDIGPDRHLAITRRIIQNDQVVGVILASFNYDFIAKSLQSVDLKGGHIELRQAALVLGGAGESGGEIQNDGTQIDVVNTSWELHYQYTNDTIFSGLYFIIGIIVICTLLTLSAFFVGYKRLSDILRQDLSSILKAFKDMMTNKFHGTYPVQLAEMNTVVSTLAQFKRVIDNQDVDVVSNSKSDFVDIEMSGFFDDFDDPITSGGTTAWMGEEESPVTTHEVSSKTIHDNIFDTVSLDKPFTEQVLEDTTPVIKSKIVEEVDKVVPDFFEMPTTFKKMADTDAIYKAYDIRGIAGKTLTKEVIYDIGRALGTQVKKQDCKTIVVGRDGRNSSPALSEALIKGLITTGLDIVDLGMVPTPMLYFVTRHTEGRSGVMITGSHNPAEYNGLKMVVNDETLAGESIQQLKACIADEAYTTSQPGNIEKNNQYQDEYIGIISEYIHLERPMTVVLDCGNGVAGELGPLLLKSLGCDVIELFCDIDGNFPNHHPDPSNPKNLTELIATVKHYKADIGIAFDGDGDRLGVVDSDGKIIWPDRQMMLFAKSVLAGNPGAEIIYDVKCSRHLADQITKYGGKPLMWKTGHSLMKAKIKETGAKLAGEMSGHIFFNDRWFGFDDALYAAARLLDLLSRDIRSSADVFADFPDSINTPELNVALKEGENFSFMDSLFAIANFSDGKVTTIDGMRVDFSDGWGLVRASNTTPSLVIRFEADNEAAMRRIQEQFRALLKQVKPDIALPF
jgi:phosphomannomutase/phosphoglucomutase